MTSYRGNEAIDWFGFSRLWSQTVGYAVTTSRIDSLESNENAKCPLTVEIQLHWWAGIFLLFGQHKIAVFIGKDDFFPFDLLGSEHDF